MLLGRLVDKVVGHDEKNNSKIAAKSKFTLAYECFGLVLLASLLVYATKHVLQNLPQWFSSRVEEYTHHPRDSLVDLYGLTAFVVVALFSSKALMNRVKMLVEDMGNGVY